MRDFIISTDSTADLPTKYLEENNICLLYTSWCFVLLQYFHDMKVIYSSYSVSIVLMFVLFYTSYKRNIYKKYFNKKEVIDVN